MILYSYVFLVSCARLDCVYSSPVPVKSHWNILRRKDDQSDQREKKNHFNFRRYVNKWKMKTQSDLTSAVQEQLMPSVVWHEMKNCETFGSSRLSLLMIIFHDFVIFRNLFVLASQVKSTWELRGVRGAEGDWRRSEQNFCFLSALKNRLGFVSYDFTSNYVYCSLRHPFFSVDGFPSILNPSTGNENMNPCR